MTSREELVDYCIDTMFEVNNVRETKDLTDYSDGEVVLAINKDSASIDWRGEGVSDDIMNHRVVPLAKLIFQVMGDFKLTPSIKLVLAPHDTITKHDKPGRTLSKTGFHDIKGTPNLALPDPHYLQSYMGKADHPRLKDTVPFGNKREQVIFRGADTNFQRVLLADRAFGHPFVDCKIHKFLMNSTIDLISKNVEITRVRGEALSRIQQMECQYILDIYGHNGSWDRTCWALGSNSLLVLLEPHQPKIYTWYYPYLEKLEAIPIVSEDDIFDVEKLKAHTDKLPLQKELGRMILQTETAKMFIRKFLMKYDGLYNS